MPFRVDIDYAETFLDKYPPVFESLMNNAEELHREFERIAEKSYGDPEWKKRIAIERAIFSLRDAASVSKIQIASLSTTIKQNNGCISLKDILGTDETLLVYYHRIREHIRELSPGWNLYGEIYDLYVEISDAINGARRIIHRMVSDIDRSGSCNI